jgi:hypothetical protein
MKYLAAGPTPDDIRHTLKGAVSYTTRFGLDFGIRARYMSGTPLWQYQVLNNPSTNLYRSPRGTGYSVVRGVANFNDPSTVSELRNPDQFVIDAQVRYDAGRLIRLPDTNRLELTLLVTNLLNNTATTTIYDQYNATTTSSNFGLSRFRNSPLQAELLLRFRN